MITCRQLPIARALECSAWNIFCGAQFNLVHGFQHFGLILQRFGCWRGFRCAAKTFEMVNHLMVATNHCTGAIRNICILWNDVVVIVIIYADYLVRILVQWHWITFHRHWLQSFQLLDPTSAALQTTWSYCCKSIMDLWCFYRWHFEMIGCCLARNGFENIFYSNLCEVRIVYRSFKSYSDARALLFRSISGDFREIGFVFPIKEYLWFFW